MINIKKPLATAGIGIIASITAMTVFMPQTALGSSVLESTEIEQQEKCGSISEIAEQFDKDKKELRQSIENEILGLGEDIDEKDISLASFYLAASDVAFTDEMLSNIRSEIDSILESPRKAHSERLAAEEAARIAAEEEAARIAAEEAAAAEAAQQSQSSYSSGYSFTGSGDEASAKEWIAQRESGGSYDARNGRYIGKYQLTDSYLNGDYSEENQEATADAYVYGRYGSWEAAQQFWLANGWY